MTDFELSKIITESLDRAKRASIGSSFVMKKGTYARLSAIERIIGSYHGTYSSDFDAATNSLDIRIEGYVFDSTTDNLKALLAIPDLFVIDALSDGKICIEMKLQNACIKLEG